jgi:putative transposase
METIEKRSPSLSLSSACDAIGFCRSSYYRLKAGFKPAKRRNVPRALGVNERQEILDIMHEERFMDLPPGQIFNHLLDEGRYIASERTMYRILADNNEIKERRKIRTHPKYKRPELLAIKPNQLWSWDITRLRGPNKLEYYQLYVIIDVYSRYVVGWMLAQTESATLAKHFIEETCQFQGIKKDSLTIHSDRGPAMKSKTVAELLAHLGVIKSHSRPRISNDNPYSESQFKTMKYSMTYPDRFGSIEDARAFCRDFFKWYNNEHYHSGIKMLTPSMVHNGDSKNVLRKRAKVKIAAYNLKQERFVNGKPKLQKLDKKVWINAPKKVEPMIVINNQEVD